ncbi:hypothetical protein L6164_005632 [Bauhinia variegata]|uniref:Uncharacterized protein n=1 Tax=Bauhinia variegata TaxID=167791 RepID=A0ACB9PUI1_BAUVA|nr:hypothetical protein L6164_005632 [Bauhinia variegata]
MFAPSIKNCNPPRFDSFKRPNVICNYNKKPGHTKNKCYRMNGFPPDFKFTKGRKFLGSVQSNVSEDVILVTLQTISPEQYNKLLSLLNNLKPANQANQTPVATDKLHRVPTKQESFP